MKDKNRKTIKERQERKCTKRKDKKGKTREAIQ